MTTSRCPGLYLHDPIEEAERAVSDAQDAIVREFAAFARGNGEGPRDVLLNHFACAVGWRFLLLRKPDQFAQAELSVMLDHLSVKLKRPRIDGGRMMYPPPSRAKPAAD